MKLSPHQLERHLRQGMAPVYCITGDEPLLMQEACDLVRRHAREAGCEERIVMHADGGFDWNSLLQEACGLSLFSQRRLLEVRLPTGKPGDAGGKALQAYVADGGGENILLLVCGKLDASSQRTRWFKAVEGAGVVVQVWPLSLQQLPDWIGRRMRQAGLQPSREAVMLLAERVEGNLLAAAQEIEKLHMLQGAGAVSADDVLAAVTDSARYDVFGLVDCALAGDVGRSMRMLDGLRAEGVEPILVLWALAREIRQLARMCDDLEQGTALAQVLARHRVWDKRKPMVSRALQRSRRGEWLAMLQAAAGVDRCLKGQEQGEVWDRLMGLVLRMAGQEVAEPA
ncbi:MAG TPA: DNA polymerase III subunit delta [Gammaproteobacteria bacterium]|nr:DNA polymerase III subunit delta [Gammaproteobacteria bacterium]